MRPAGETAVGGGTREPHGRVTSRTREPGSLGPIRPAATWVPGSFCTWFPRVSSGVTGTIVPISQGCCEN